MPKQKQSLKKKEPLTFEERIHLWSGEVKPGPGPTRILTRERRPPDRYVPPPFKGQHPKTSPVPPQVSLKRFPDLAIRIPSASKRTKVDTLVTQMTQAKHLISFKPAMHGRTPKEFLKCVQKEETLLYEFEHLSSFLRLHISPSTMSNDGLIPTECKQFIESSQTLQDISYDFPPEPQVYGEDWAGVVGRGAVIVQTVGRVLEKAQLYNAQSPEYAWSVEIVMPILDLMQYLHNGSILSMITQNQDIEPLELCPKDQNVHIPQSGRKNVDHILGLKISEGEEAILRNGIGFSGSANQSLANSLSSVPIFLDVEVKTVNKKDPVVPLRVWEAAGHVKREMEGWDTDMPMLGIVVDGHRWSLQIGFWSPKDERLIFGALYYLGSTDDIVSIFHIISNLHKICNWANIHYRDWFEKQLAGYANIPQTEIQQGIQSKGKGPAQGSEEENNADDEGFFPGGMEPHPKATAEQIQQRSTRWREALRSGVSPESENLQHELKLIALYEHSRLRGHKTCAYRGCHEDERLKGDGIAFTMGGDPRKDFQWLHQRLERENRKEHLRAVENRKNNMLEAKKDPSAEVCERI